MFTVLMTSFRDFENDNEWNYLRPSAGKEWFSFEDQGDGRFELIVPKEWPTRVRSFQFMFRAFAT